MLIAAEKKVVRLKINFYCNKITISKAKFTNFDSISNFSTKIYIFTRNFQELLTFFHKTYENTCGVCDNSYFIFNNNYFMFLTVGGKKEKLILN